MTTMAIKDDVKTVVHDNDDRDDKNATSAIVWSAYSLTFFPYSISCIQFINSNKSPRTKRNKSEAPQPGKESDHQLIF